MNKINKFDLPNMQDGGSIRISTKYILAEYSGQLLEDLAEIIVTKIDTNFILYDYKGNLFTDNEDVLELLNDEYPSGMVPSKISYGFNEYSVTLSIDEILKLNKNKKYERINFTYIPKWNFIYRKLAKILIDFRGHNILVEDSINSNSIGNLLYRELVSDENFLENNNWIRKFKSIWKVESLDPIHILASLNNNNLGYEKRVRRINILFEILDDNFNKHYNDINFDGCPAPMTINIIGARDEDTQEEVWNVFYEIMEKSQDSRIDFSKIQKWYGIDIGAFTIFLFWIDAKNFLPLDKNTEALLEKYNKLNKLPTKYQEYKKLLPLRETNLYLLLALVSYDNKKQKLLSREEKEKLFNYLEIKSSTAVEEKYQKIDEVPIEKHTIEESNKFKFISIKPLEGCHEKYLKTLQEEEIYILDKAYSVYDKVIKIDEEKDLSLFDLDNINININAIVGKNGTGKSTIVELLFAIINHISFTKKINKDIIQIDDLRVELIFESSHLYKIIINDDTIKILQYAKENNQYINPIELNISEFDLDELFYTIAVNYSQHSLNSLYMGPWIHSLFHKNDAYQTPIVIEPYRKHGDINISRQEELIKQRLVTNLLLQEDSDDKKNSSRQLTEFYRAKSLNLSFNINKLFYLTENKKQLVGKHIFKDKEKNYSIGYSKFKDSHVNIINTLFSKYKMGEINKIDFYNEFNTYSFEEKVYLYILKKLVSIAYRYKKYKVFFDKENKKFLNFDNYIIELYDDKSHIVYKLKQAINFLRFESIVEKKEELQSLSIEDLSNRIEKIKLDYKEERLTINELLPPSFFNIDIILDKYINFNSLSSGEKQKIYSVNSILYHINNINSVDNSLIQYKNVNIILDEIELYFHPELQRNYLSYLRHSISKANTNNILAINILFVTHSPFILSDIPDTKILFLEKNTNDINAKTIVSQKKIKTFGANIHELLINGFFMDSSIGEFALNKIKSIVDFHYKVINFKEIDLNDLKVEYQTLKGEFYFIQEHIGEEYISGVIKNHITDIEKRLKDDSFNKKRITILQKELEELQRHVND